MNRAIIISSEHRALADSYWDRLFKYIPAEIIAFYMAAKGIVDAMTPRSRVLEWAIFAVGLAATPLYLNMVQKVTAWPQWAMSTLAFVIWVAAIGGPFLNIDGYSVAYGELLLLCFTLFSGFVAPKKSAVLTGVEQ